MAIGSFDAFKQLQRRVNLLILGNPLKPINLAEYFGCLMNLVTSYDKNIFYLLCFAI